MADIWICLNIFNEEIMLPECLQNIKSNMPHAKIVAVDGCYLPWYQEVRVLAASCFSKGHNAMGEEFMRFASGSSNDKTIQILKDFKIERIIEAPEGKPWPSEHTKRSQYLQVGKPGDWVFVLDADERINGQAPTVESLEAGGSLDYCVMLRRDDDPPSNPYPVLRVHKKTEEYMRYRKAHHHMWRGDKIVRKADVEHLLVPNMIVEHYWRKRSEMTPTRHRCKGQYYVRLLEQIEALPRAVQGF